MRACETNSPAQTLTPPPTASIFVMFPTRQEEGELKRRKDASDFLTKNGAAEKTLPKRIDTFILLHRTRQAKNRTTVARMLAEKEEWPCRNGPCIAISTMENAQHEANAEVARNAALISHRAEAATEASAAVMETIKQGATAIAQNELKSPAGKAATKAILASMQAAAPELVQPLAAEAALEIAQKGGQKRRAAPNNRADNKKPREAQQAASSESDSDFDPEL